MASWVLWWLIWVTASVHYCTKPLPEPILINHQLNTRESISLELYSKFKLFHSTKCILNHFCICKRGNNFVRNLYMVSDGLKNKCPILASFNLKSSCTATQVNVVCDFLFSSTHLKNPNPFSPYKFTYVTCLRSFSSLLLWNTHVCVCKNLQSIEIAFDIFQNLI